MAVGQIAKERLITHPKDTAASFKKKMGTTQKLCAGRAEFSAGRAVWICDQCYRGRCQKLSAGGCGRCYYLCAGIFHDKQRVATKRAGALAGVMVKRIINEPSAAALASYFDNQTGTVVSCF